MLKSFLIPLIMAIAIISVIILITFKSLNKIILFITLIVNIISCIYMIFDIQSIGWNIYFFSLLFIFSNNILLSLIRFIIQNLSLNNFIREKLINIWLFYTKVIYTYPFYILRKLLSTSGKVLDIINNRINNVVHDLAIINPLKLLNKEYDEKSKCMILTFEKNFLLDHKNLFAALFAGLILQSEFKKIGKKIMIVSIFSEERKMKKWGGVSKQTNNRLFCMVLKLQNNI